MAGDCELILTVSDSALGCVFFPFQDPSKASEGPWTHVWPLVIHNAEKMSEGFLYQPEWQALLCKECGFCLSLRRDLWLQHLRQRPHCLRGAPLKALVELFGSYDLRAPEQVAVPTQAVAGQRLLDGFQCLMCLSGLTQSLLTIRLHMSKVHRQKPALHR